MQAEFLHHSQNYCDHKYNSDCCTQQDFYIHLRCRLIPVPDDVYVLRNSLPIETERTGELLFICCCLLLREKRTNILCFPSLCSWQVTVHRPRSRSLFTDVARAALCSSVEKTRIVGIPLFHGRLSTLLMLSVAVGSEACIRRTFIFRLHLLLDIVKRKNNKLSILHQIYG